MADLPVLHWHKQNRFRLLRNGDAFFPAMLDAIATANRSVLLELYLFESGRTADRFIRELCDAAARGVRVRVMVDGFGSLALSAQDRDTLRGAGVELGEFNPLRVLGDAVSNLARDHRKLLVVDDRIAFVGGAGITDEFSPEHSPGDYWRETMVAVEGAVVHDWARLFLHAWTGAGHRPFRLLPVGNAPRDARQLGRVAVSHGPALQDVKEHVLGRIARAQRRVWLATPYFLPSVNLRRALVRAARRGVDVQLLLPGGKTDHTLLRVMSHHYYGRLLAQGIRIHEYQPRFMHAKVVLVDDWVTVGSCNFDRWNLRWNLEANQEVEDAGFAAEVAAMFEEDIAQSSSIDADSWERRWPLLRRLESSLEDAGSAIERWLNRR